MEHYIINSGSLENYIIEAESVEDAAKTAFLQFLDMQDESDSLSLLVSIKASSTGETKIALSYEILKELIGETAKNIVPEHGRSWESFRNHVLNK